MDHLALRAWNLLATGQGGIDWAGLELVAEFLGITDIEGLLQRFEAIQRHEPPPEPKKG